MRSIGLRGTHNSSHIGVCDNYKWAWRVGLLCTKQYGYLGNIAVDLMQNFNCP